MRNFINKNVFLLLLKIDELYNDLFYLSIVFEILEIFNKKN